MIATVQKYSFWGLKSPQSVMVSGSSSMDPMKIVHLDPARGLTASLAPELH